LGLNDYPLSDRKVTSGTIPLWIERGVTLDLDSNSLLDKEIILNTFSPSDMRGRKEIHMNLVGLSKRVPNCAFSFPLGVRTSLLTKVNCPSTSDTETIAQKGD
jgi:hypothetical protein